MSSRVAAPAALRTSAVTGRRAQGMSVRARPLAHSFRTSPPPERVPRGLHAARRATDRAPARLLSRADTEENSIRRDRATARAAPETANDFFFQKLTMTENGKRKR
jgi:hypothetical protein